MSLNNIIYFDFDLFGRTDNGGNIIVYKNEEAIVNAIRMWFASRTGDRLRSPNTGGFLDFQVSKLMSTDRIESLRLRIGRALEEDFNNVFSVVKIEVLPDYNLRLLNVSLDITFAELGSNFSLDLKMRMIN